MVISGALWHYVSLPIAFKVSLKGDITRSHWRARACSRWKEGFFYSHTTAMVWREWDGDDAETKMDFNDGLAKRDAAAIPDLR
jgi:hypothetical protein